MSINKNPDDIVLCQRCGENVFFEDTINIKNGLICKVCNNSITYHHKESIEEL